MTSLFRSTPTQPNMVKLFNYSVHNSFKHALLPVLCVAVTLGMNACSVYKPEVGQGNIVTAQQITELQVGMNRQQVQQILGSPLLQDMFTTQRWDYVYRKLKSKGELEQRTLTLYFDKASKLSRWTGAETIESDTDNNEISHESLSANTLATSKLTAVNAIDNTPNSAPTTPATVSSNTATQPITAVQTSTNQTTSFDEKQLASPDLNQILTKHLKNWQSAWQTKNLGQYAAFYADNFQGTFSSHDVWLEQRQRVFDLAGTITLQISDVQIFQTSSTEARVAFTQSYQSAQLLEVGNKRLFFQRFGNEWKIVSENFVKTPSLELNTK